MDYTVGSLADLITGANTPNKPKVTKIKIKHEDNENTDSLSISEKVEKKKKSKDRTIKKRKAGDLTPLKNKKLKTSNSLLVDSDEEVSNTESISNDKNEVTKKKKQKKEHDPEELASTIFVGNVPLKTEKKKIKRHFKKYGPINNLRFRGIPVANPKIPKKVAAIKEEFHPDRHSLYCYIRFINKEDAKKALAENGALFEEHHLRVHSCNVKENPDESKAIFIGNLSFNAEEEELWKLFESCGPISHVRIVRDSYTGMGKGFAYVNFKDSDSVQLALEMENVKLGNRELRIAPSSVSSAKKSKKNQNQKAVKLRWRNKQMNKKNELNETSVEKDDSKKTLNKGFQGAKFNLKKKNKVNKGLLTKKRNIKKISPIVK